MLQIWQMIFKTNGVALDQSNPTGEEFFIWTGSGLVHVWGWFV